MKRAAIIIGIVLIGIAYLLGFWPEYQKVQRTQNQLKVVATELSNTEAQTGLYRLQHQLLAVVRETNQKNYGQASNSATKFFDSVRDELPRQADPKVKKTLQSMLQQRDAVIAALAKGDPSALGLLQPMENTMFKTIDDLMAGKVSESSPE